MRRTGSVTRYELDRRCDEVLHYVWDPIGVSGIPQARDEYSGYVPHVAALLQDGATEEELVRYLESAARDAMGLSSYQKGANKAAAILIDWRERLDELPLTEEDFWARLEYRLCREFDGNEEWRRLELWCDGIYPETVDLDASPQWIAGEAWIGGSGMDRWAFRLVLPTRVAKRADIDWSALLPANDVTGWLTVESHDRRLGIDPGIAIPDPA